MLIASHPTRGVDVGAQAAIWDHLRNARAAGLAVLLISADLDELIGMSDTLRVILRGRLVEEVDPRSVTPENSGRHDRSRLGRCWWRSAVVTMRDRSIDCCSTSSRPWWQAVFAAAITSLILWSRGDSPRS